MKLIVSNNSILYAAKFSRFEEKYGDDALDSYMIWSLTPVAIYDYVNPDYSDQQGWLQEIPHTGKIDSEEILQYPYVESFKDALEEFGFAFIDVDTIFVRNSNDGENITRATAEEAVANAFDLW